MLTDQEKIDLVNALDFVVIEPHTQSIYVHNDEKTKGVLAKVLHTISVEEYIESFKKWNLIDIFPAKKPVRKGLKMDSLLFCQRNFMLISVMR